MLDPRSMERLTGVHQDLRAVFIRGAEICPLKMTVTQGLRTLEQQQEYYEKGVSKTMDSRHLTGHAVDFLIWKDGKDAWKFETEAEQVALLKIGADALKKAAGELGITIEWGWDLWRWDAAHIQLPWSLYPKGKQVSYLKPFGTPPVVKDVATWQTRVSPEHQKLFDEAQDLKTRSGAKHVIIVF